MDDRDARSLLAKLDEIEAELKRIGYWHPDPPDLQREYREGRMRTYLDAPSFELWLQRVFLPNARVAVEARDLPANSEVGEMARRQYDYQEFVPEAQELLRMLRRFDRLVMKATD